jgi:hypothetical protein
MTSNSTNTIIILVIKNCILVGIIGDGISNCISGKGAFFLPGVFLLGVVVLPGVTLDGVEFLGG